MVYVEQVAQALIDLLSTKNYPTQAIHKRYVENGYLSNGSNHIKS